MNPASLAVLYGLSIALVARERIIVETTLYRLRRIDRLLEDGRGREARRVMARLHAEREARRARHPHWNV